jgi:hypothetical protein
MILYLRRLPKVATKHLGVVTIIVKIYPPMKMLLKSHNIHERRLVDNLPLEMKIIRKHQKLTVEEIQKLLPTIQMWYTFYLFINKITLN